MENLGHSSSNIMSDFEFKYIPKMELQKVMRKVENDKKQKKEIGNVETKSLGGRNEAGIWGNYCTTSSINEKRMSDVKKVPQTKVRSSAPFLGPPRIPNIPALKNSQVSSHQYDEDNNDDADERNIETTKAALASHSSNSNLSVHIVEEVNVADVQKTFDAKIQVPKKITTNDAAFTDDCEDDDDDDSQNISSDNDETLHSEILELCNQIEKENGNKSMSTTTNDNMYLNQRKENEKKKKKKNFVNTTEKEFTSEKCSNYVDKKFDFLYENFEALKIDQQSLHSSSSFDSQLQLSMKKAKKKIAKKHEKIFSEDSTNDNNVYIPKMRNQMSKNEKQQQKPCCIEKSSVKTERNVTSPRESSHKVQNDVASDVLANEKSQAAESAHFHHLLKKIASYQEKISEYIERLLDIIRDPPQLEDINDLNKRQRRAAEFTNRFARNYLYQIGRLAEELRLMPDNPMVDVASKVNLLFHAIMQAVLAYLRNVEMFIYNSYPDKLFILVDFIINSSKICFDRKFYDKKNEVVVRMLRKSVEMKRFLEINQKSVAKYEIMMKKSPPSRQVMSRSSHTYEKSIYGSEPTKKLKQFSMKSKSPYDVLPKNPYEFSLHRKPSKASLHSRQQKQKNPPPPSSHRNTTAMKVKSQSPPGVKKSISNISTMVENCKEKEEELACHDENEPAEKPLEGVEEATKSIEQIEKPKEVTEIMEMLRNIAKEKIQEIIAPYMENIVQNSSEQKRMPRVTADVQPSRVTADIKPQKPPAATKESLERRERIAPNIQYIYIQSKNDSEETLKAEEKEDLEIAIEPSSTSIEVPKTKIVTSILKPPLQIDYKENLSEQHGRNDDEKDVGFLESKIDEKKENFKQIIINERDNFVKSMIGNPLYVNEQYDQPWKVFSNVSDAIIDEMLKNLISQFDFGEKAFIEKYFKHELAC